MKIATSMMLPTLTSLVMKVQSLSVIPSHPNAVMVTQGSCESKGYRTIENKQECELAASGYGVLEIRVQRETRNSIFGRFRSHGCTMLKVNGQLQANLRIRKNRARFCSDSAPCFCIADDLEVLPVCENGVFDPQLDTYYSIGSPNHRFLTDVDRRMSRSPNSQDDINKFTKHFEARNVGSTNEFDARAHWRFVPAGDNFWYIRNRSTGKDIGVDDSTLLEVQDRGLAGQTKKEDGIRWSVFCRGKDVIIQSLDNDHSPRDCCFDFLGNRDIDGKREILFPGVQMSDRGNTVGAEHVFPGCFLKKRDCEELVGPGFFKDKRLSLCNLAGTAERKRCKRITPAPISINVQHRWFIHEVEVFKRGGGLDNAPVALSSSFEAEAFISDNLASSLLIGGFNGAVAAAGTALAIATPVTAAAFLGVATLGLNVIFGSGPDPTEALAEAIGEALDQFAIDVENRIDDAIKDGFAAENARQLSNIVLIQRRWFLTVYPGLKQDRLADQNQAEINGLADILQFTKVQGMEADIQQQIGFDTSPTELNAKRSHAAFEILKVGLTELLNMAQEAVLLRALANPEDTCESIIDLHNLDNMSARALTMLEDAVDQIRGFVVDESKFESDELVFDIENFSYPITVQQTAFQSFVTETEKKCEKLREDPDARVTFESDTFLLLA